jgi:hypothetical protein
MLEHTLREGVDSKYLLGHKRDAYAYLETHHVELWNTVRSAESVREAILALLHVPGLGIVKSAFICQLAGFNVACLDSRNNKRLGLNADRYRTRGGKSKQGKAVAKKVDAYIAETGGRAREFWDTWCADVAGFWGSTPHEISAIHLAILV